MSEGEFSWTNTIAFSDLPEQMQQIATGAMGWLGAQLPDGMQTVKQVILERNVDAPTAWSEVTEEQPSVPTAWSPAFSISVTGLGDKGESTLSIASVPGALTNATAQLWDYLATL